MPVNNVPMGGWCHELASSASVGAMGGREVGGGRTTVHGRWEGGPPGQSAVHGRDQSTRSAYHRCQELLLLLTC